MRRSLGQSVLLFTTVAVGTSVLMLAQAPQSSDQKPLAFAVASIKRTADTTASPSFSVGPGNRLHIVNNPLTNIIGNTYDLPLYRIADAPGWVNSERFDIEARAGGEMPRKEMMLMLQALLADRFKLKSHRESRQGPVYVLRVARGGHKLHASTEGGCVPTDPRRPPRGSEPNRPACGDNLTFDRGTFTAWRATRITVTEAAETLSREVRRTIIDQTGVTGVYDISVDLPALEAVGAGSDAAPVSGPSFFTVLREQLGLTLEPAKGPVDVLVIDHIERPTPD
jgi:uncharacterized protein (TIGR03435 family)